MLRTILDALPVSITFRDVENRFVYINRHAVMRYSMSVEGMAGKVQASDFIGKVLREVLGEGASSTIEPIISKVVATGQPLLDYEMVGPHTGGNLVFNIVPVIDHQGAGLGAATIVMDITKRRLVEQALRDAEAFNQAVMDNMIDAHIVIDRMGAVRTFNRAAENLFGYQSDEVIGRNVAMLMTASDRDGHDNYLSSYLTTGSSAILGKGPREVAGRHKDGSRLFLELNIGRIDSGDGVHFIGSLRDVSERKNSEAALQQSQDEAVKARRQLVDAIDSIPEGFALYDQAHRMILHNKTLRQMYPALVEGFDRKATFEELLNMATRAGLVTETPGGKGDWAAERKAAFGQSRTATEQNLQDGRWVLISDQPTTDGGIVSVRTDITELKQREDELRQAQKMEALGQLTGGVAHDFNNLLAVMMGNIALIEEELGPDSPLLDLTEPTLKAIEQASELTNRMLSFARRQPLELQIFEPNRLLNSMEPLLRQALVEDIRIEFSLKSDTWACRADLGQLEQAILNLTINARDAMPQGGTVRVETNNLVLPDPAVDGLSNLPAGDYVTISVTDTGTGISAANLPKIFDPFFTTKGVGEGSGLGLSMVHGFAKQSMGDIRVLSETGIGTTFCLYLPRAEVATEVAAGGDVSGISSELSPPPPVGNESILVIEDEPDVKLMVARSLEKFGYRVLTAANGQAGLDALEADSEIDMLLTDVLLPGGMNGPQVADRATAENPELRDLFMSGYARDTIIEQGRLQADVRLLSKPFVPAELGRRVRETLDDA